MVGELPLAEPEVLLVVYWPEQGPLDLGHLGVDGRVGEPPPGPAGGPVPAVGAQSLQGVEQAHGQQGSG